MKKETIIIIILGILLCGAVGYITYDKVLNNKEEIVEKEEKEENEEKEPVVNSKELTEEDVKTYIEDMTTFTSYFGDMYPLKIENMDNNLVLQYGVRQIISSKNTSIIELQFTTNELQEQIAKVYGKDYSYTVGDINCPAEDGVLFQLNKDTNTYHHVGEHGHGGWGSYRLKIYFIDAKEENDKMEINTKILYGGYCGDTCGPITDFYNVAKPKDYVKDSIYQVSEADMVNEDNYEKAYKQVQEHLKLTKFIYQKQSDGKYGLKEIEVEG